MTTTGANRNAAPGWARYLAHRDRLLRIARSRTATYMDAEDAVQETLLRAAANGEELDEDRIPGWLTAVTIRLCVDSHRSREREARHWGRKPGDPAPRGVDEEVCERDWATWVARHLDKLPPRQRAALLLRADGHDTEAVAHQLGISYQSAESLLARARRALRSLLLPVVVGLAAVWQVIAQAAGRSARTTLVASATGIVALSALAYLQGDFVPRRPPPAVTPVHAPVRAPSSAVPSQPGTGPPRTSRPATPAAPSRTPTPRPENSLPPVPLIPSLDPLPLPELPTPSVSVSPGLPLPTLGDSLLPKRRTNLPAA